MKRGPLAGVALPVPLSEAALVRSRAGRGVEGGGLDWLLEKRMEVRGWRSCPGVSALSLM